MHEIFDNMNPPTVTPRVPARVFRQLRPISDLMLKSSPCFMYLWFDDHPVQRIPWFILLESVKLPVVEPRPIFRFPGRTSFPTWGGHPNKLEVSTIDEGRLSGLESGIIPPSVRLMHDWVYYMFNYFNNTYINYYNPPLLYRDYEVSKNVSIPRNQLPLSHSYKLDGTLVIHYTDGRVFEYQLEGLYINDVMTNFPYNNGGTTSQVELTYDFLISRSEQVAHYDYPDTPRIGVTEIMVPEREQEGPAQSRDSDTRDGPISYDPSDDTSTIIDS